MTVDGTADADVSPGVRTVRMPLRDGVVWALLGVSPSEYIEATAEAWVEVEP